MRAITDPGVRLDITAGYKTVAPKKDLLDTPWLQGLDPHMTIDELRNCLEAEQEFSRNNFYNEPELDLYDYEETGSGLDIESTKNLVKTPNPLIPALIVHYFEALPNRIEYEELFMNYVNDLIHPNSLFRRFRMNKNGGLSLREITEQYLPKLLPELQDPHRYILDTAFQDQVRRSAEELDYFVGHFARFTNRYLPKQGSHKPFTIKEFSSLLSYYQFLQRNLDDLAKYTDGPIKVQVDESTLKLQRLLSIGLGYWV